MSERAPGRSPQRRLAAIQRLCATLSFQVLLLFVLGSTVPLAFLVYQARLDGQQAEERALRQAAFAAQIVAADVDDALLHTRNTAQTLAHLPAFWDGDDGVRDEMLTAFAGPESTLNHLVFVGQDLRDHGMSGHTQGAERTDFSSRGYLRKARDTRRLAVTDRALRSLIDGAIVLPLAIPIQNPRDPAQNGFFLAGIGLERLPTVWAAVPLPDGASTMLLDRREGRILTAYPPGELGTDEVVAQPTLANIAAGETAFHVSGADGVEYLRSWAPVSGTSWIVSVDIPSRAVLQPIYDDAARAAAIRVLTLLAGIAVLLVLGRRLLVRLHRLQQATTHWARGEWGYRPLVSGSDELGQLAMASNAMASKLHSAAEQLAAHEAARERALARHEVLLRRARRFAAEASPQHLLGELIAESVKLLEADDAGIARWDPATGALVQVRSFLPGSGMGEVLDPERSASGQAAATSRTVIVHDYQRRVGPITPGGRAGAQAAVAVPLLHEGRLMGTLSVSAFDPNRRFSQEDAESLELLVGLAAATLVGLEQARLEGALLAVRTLEHELNNKLALTRGYAEILALAPSLAPSLREAAEEAVRGADEAAQLFLKLQRMTAIEERHWGPLAGPTIDLSRSHTDPEGRRSD